jgi:hypothetical protein
MFLSEKAGEVAENIKAALDKKMVLRLPLKPQPKSRFIFFPLFHTGVSRKKL